MGTDAQPINLCEFEDAAKALLAKVEYDYIAGLPAAPPTRLTSAAIGGKLEVFLDGGIRRGADVLKAIALGVRAVFIGRPLFWGLAVGGEQRVVRVVNLLREEFEISLAKCGRPTIASIDSATIVRVPLL